MMALFVMLAVAWVALLVAAYVIGAWLGGRW